MSQRLTSRLQRARRESHGCDAIKAKKKNTTETNCIVRTLRVPTRCDEWDERAFPRVRPYKVQCVRSATSAKRGLGESQRDSAKARPSQLWKKCDWFRVRRASQLLIRIYLTPVEGTFATACCGKGKRRRRQQDLRGVAVGTIEKVCPTRIAPLAANRATSQGLLKDNSARRVRFKKTQMTTDNK